MNSIMADLTIPMITNIVLPNSIKSPLYVKGVLACSNDLQLVTLDQRIYDREFKYNIRTQAFEGFCPCCEVKATVSNQAVICLIENPEHVVCSNGHWVTLRGSPHPDMNAYLDLIAKFPFMNPNQNQNKVSL